MIITTIRSKVLRNPIFIGLIYGIAFLCQPRHAHADPSQPYIGEISCGGWNFCPNGWLACDGQLIPISENETLFNLIGTTYGGDGQTTFALPNLQGRTMIHQGQGSGLSNRVQGETGGVESVTLISLQMPSHNHGVAAHAGTEKAASPTGRIAGPTASSAYVSSPAGATLAPTAVVANGGSQPHNNLQPYLAVRCCIAQFGIFPSPS